MEEEIDITDNNHLEPRREDLSDMIDINEELTVRQEEKEFLAWYSYLDQEVKTPALTRAFRVIYMRDQLERKKE